MPTDGHPQVEVIVVNWRRAELTIECLASLRDQIHEADAHVTVVDNGSGDDSVGRLREAAPWAEVLELAENRGFAAGVNAALARTTAPIAILLNNDAVATPGFIRALVAPLDRDAGLAATTARILLREPDGAVRLTNSTGNLVDPAGNGQDRDWLAPHPVDAPADVFGFCGGACAVRVDAVRDAGTFDETLFMYYEDTDMSWRLRRNGFAIRYVADAVALHRHASSSGVDSELFISTNTANRLTVALRHGPWGMVLRALGRSVMRAAVSTVRGVVDSEERRRARWRRRGLAAFVRSVPIVLRQRRRIDRTAVVPRGAVLPALDG